MFGLVFNVLFVYKHFAKNYALCSKEFHSFFTSDNCNYLIKLSLLFSFCFQPHFGAFSRSFNYIPRFSVRTAPVYETHFEFMQLKICDCSVSSRALNLSKNFVVNWEGFMSNETATKVSNFFSAAYSPTREYSTAKIKSKASFPTQPRTSQLPTKPSEMKYSMVTAISSGYVGVLLPICLLAIFLSCVVCVYHWQGITERRLDLEEDRKRCQRKRTMSEFDSGCALRTIKPVNKVRQSVFFLLIDPSIFVQ